MMIQTPPPGWSEYAWFLAECLLATVCLLTIHSFIRSLFAKD